MSEIYNPLVNRTKMTVEGVYWNPELHSIEIEFSKEETPVTYSMEHPIKIYWHETRDGRIMKLEIGGLDKWIK